METAIEAALAECWPIHTIHGWAIHGPVVDTPPEERYTCPMSNLQISRGWPLPLGCSVRGDGVRFSLFSRHATQLHLLLFDGARDGEPSHDIPFDPAIHRIGDIWTIKVDGIGAGQLYAFRADGPNDPATGQCFDPDLLLIDPYARAVTDGSAWLVPDWLPGSLPPGSMTPEQRRELWAAMPKCIATRHNFDWGDDPPVRHPLKDSVIYEVHVRGFTRHPSSGVDHPGTYRGVVERIPYLKELGVTAVELLPVQEYDEYEVPLTNPLTGAKLSNYWGYSPFAFFAPEGRYSELGSDGGQINAFKGMVKELHRAGIEVILDVVFNHTAEGDERGPTLSMRGLDNTIYYMLDDGGAGYRNFSGCGNTVNCNHPHVRELIIDCLRHWVMEMHVDGFRFDLASILGRDTDGQLLENPPLLEAIAEDAVLRGTKLIAEAWDAGGAYQVGSFPGRGWAEWNGRYRDDIRRFWRGDDGMLGAFATRLSGSSDLYQRSGRRPYHSINFITAHDGFTLADLVSYEHKHNEANAEGNRDGSSQEHSSNHGHEGPTEDPEIRAARSRHARNLMVTLLVSQGVPMILGGDEFGRTQGGNNNAYCQDDETTWFDWQLAQQNRGLLRFCQQLIHRRRRHGALRRSDFFRRGDHGEPSDIQWLGPQGREPGWNDPAARALGCRVVSPDPQEPPYLMLFNAGDGLATFSLPEPPVGWDWGLFIDTARSAPDDIVAEKSMVPLANPGEMAVAPHSAVVLHGLSARR